MCLHPALLGPKRLKLLHHCRRVNEPFCIERVCFQGLFYFVPLSLKLSSLWCKASLSAVHHELQVFEGKSLLGQPSAFEFLLPGSHLAGDNHGVERDEMLSSRRCANQKDKVSLHPISVPALWLLTLKFLPVWAGGEFSTSSGALLKGEAAGMEAR